MKKILISAIVKPHDDSVTIENLQEVLRKLGSTYFTFSAEVELADATGLSKEAWIYISADDGEPYVLVPKRGETEGEELSNEEADRLRAHGVVTEFYAEYPRADKYGSPMFSNDDDYAAGVIGSHLFKVEQENLVVYSEDRGDDGCEQIWIKIALPSDYELPAGYEVQAK